jgi:general secretion pathway protein E/type IV pilus assembly protein PilB
MATSLAELLIENDLVSREQLTQATKVQETNGGRLDRALIELGYIEEDELLRVVGENLHLPVIELSEAQIDTELMRRIPARIVHRRGLLPLADINGALLVATSDPFNVYALDELRMLTGLKIEPVLARDGDIQKAIREEYGVAGDTLDEMISQREGVDLLEEQGPSQADLVEQAQEASVVKLVNEILLEAIKQRASDVHLEPFENRLRVRYRIDGVLQTTNIAPQVQRFAPAIVNRLKILSQLNIAEKRLPQDGGFNVRVGGREIDVRVSVIPMQFGEGVVLRILDKSIAMLSLGDLGMDNETLKTWDELIHRPHGILLVTGPTGSGKTTTLYSALSRIVSDEIKTITVEDPIEYTLSGVNQIQVLPQIGMTFARGLRSILRHDPDVVMIGEIRDLETAEAAVQASLTGHLVFSTLHTNDACSAATRLLDMGLEPFLVTSSLEAVMAQRLVRRVCPKCKYEVQPKRESLPKDFPYEEGMTLQYGKGCEACNGIGFHGRLGIFELLLIDDETRELVLQRASASHLFAAARKHGLRTLREDGWDKVCKGLTTPEEVLRATKA